MIVPQTGNVGSEPARPLGSGTVTYTHLDVYKRLPFGYLLTPNITPDEETGIGRWSSADFYRAMHDGVNKRGQDMYPAMPYDFYTKLTRADSDAIFALSLIHISSR